MAEGAYVSNHDLRNGHQWAMQRLVQGGDRAKGKTPSATAALMRKGLKEAMASWEGITDEMAKKMNELFILKIIFMLFQYNNV